MTISGSNSGVIAQGQSITQNTGPTADQVAELIADVRKAIAGLGDRDRIEAEVLADILEEELAEEQPRPAKVKRICARLVVLLGEAAAAGSIGALVSGIIGRPVGPHR